LIICYNGEKKLIIKKKKSICVYNIWGTVLAIIFPDLRECNLFFEYENFWIEHFMLVIVPIVFIFKKRFLLYPYHTGIGKLINYNYNINDISILTFIAFCAFLVHAIWHSLVLSIVALYSGRNLNYLLSPPPGILQNFGRSYRVVMYCACLLLTILIGGPIVLMGRAYYVKQRRLSNLSNQEKINETPKKNSSKRKSVKLK
jgi:hypothetical protein